MRIAEYINGETVYRDMTEKEIEEIKKTEIEHPETIEEQILALQNALITSKISGGV